MERDPCPRCGGPHPFHVVVRARSDKRWRGRNFDAAAAEGAAGAALMRAIGLDPGSPRDFDAFAREAVVVAARVERLAENPLERFDPAEGETWEFHLALRRALSEAQEAAARAEVARAVGASRGFSVL